VSGRSSASQASDFVRGRIVGEFHEVPTVAPLLQSFAAPLLQGSRALGIVDGGRAGLLTVRDVAAQLGVCTATVYRLVGEDQLAHVRVLNAIRVAPRDLEAFVESRRQAGRAPDGN
jgi:excisionase family DNA binding protein